MCTDTSVFDIDESFGTAREFVDFFLDDNVFEPKSVFDVAGKNTSSYVFRGQSNKDWRLLPSAHRSTGAYKEYTPQPPSERLLTEENEVSETNRLKYLGHHAHAEWLSVKLFLEAADSVGIQTPLDYGHFSLHLNLFNSLFSEDNEAAGRNFPDSRLLPAFALAQHHGVPTRLLDWTESPFIAGFFAAYSAVGKPAIEADDSEISVVGLGLNLLSQVDDIEAVSVPQAHNSFILAQRGLFTVVKNSNELFLKNGTWPSLEDVVASGRDTNTRYMRPPLIRFTLPASESVPLLKLLYRLGISRLTLMPSLDQAASDYKYKKALWGKNNVPSQ